jgi:O-antigen ligase
LVFVASCSFLNVPLTSMVVFAYCAVLALRKRTEVVDLLAVWLVAAPFLGPHMVVELRGLPDISFNRLFVLLLIYCHARRRDRSTQHSRRVFNGIDFGLIMFLVACLVSMLGSIMVRTPARLFLDAWLVPCVFYFVAKRSASRPDFLAKIFIASWLAVSALGAMGLYEGVTRQDLLKFEGESVHKEGTADFRVNGPFDMAEAYGLVLTMLLVTVLVLKKPMGKAAPIRSRYVRLTILLALGGVAFTSTRTVWISLAVSWLVYQTRRRPLLTLSFTTLAAAFVWFLSTSVLPQMLGDYWQARVTQERTVYSRLATYQSALAMFEDHPLFGVGFGTFSENWERFPERYQFKYMGEESVNTPHNGLLAILSELGLIGIVAFFALQIQVFLSAARLSRVAGGLPGGRYGEAAIAVVIAFIVAGLGLSFTQDIGFVNKTYLLVLGILSGLTDGARRMCIAREPWRRG